MRSPVAEEGEAERRLSWKEAADPSQSLQECGRVPGAPGGTSFPRGPGRGLRTWPAGRFPASRGRGTGVPGKQRGTLGVPTPSGTPLPKRGTREAGAVKGKNLSPLAAERWRAWGRSGEQPGAKTTGRWARTCGASARRPREGPPGARRAGRWGL